MDKITQEMWNRLVAQVIPEDAEKLLTDQCHHILRENAKLAVKLQTMDSQVREAYVNSSVKIKLLPGRTTLVGMGISEEDADALITTLLCSD